MVYETEQIVKHMPLISTLISCVAPLEACPSLVHSSVNPDCHRPSSPLTTREWNGHRTQKKGGPMVTGQKGWWIHMAWNPMPPTVSMLHCFLVAKVSSLHMRGGVVQRNWTYDCFEHSSMFVIACSGKCLVWTTWTSPIDVLFWLLRTLTGLYVFCCLRTLRTNTSVTESAY